MEGLNFAVQVCVSVQTSAMGLHINPSITGQSVAFCIGPTHYWDLLYLLLETQYRSVAFIILQRERATVTMGSF
jgi:hypothetical protein